MPGRGLRRQPISFSLLRKIIGGHVATSASVCKNLQGFAPSANSVIYVDTCGTLRTEFINRCSIMWQVKSHRCE